MATSTNTNSRPPLHHPTMSTGHRPFVFVSFPPAESLPPPVFDSIATTLDGVVFEANPTSTSPSASSFNRSCSSPEVGLPPTVTQRAKYFAATVVSMPSDRAVTAVRISGQCPRWSKWATSQFTFDYLFMLITSGKTPEMFKRRYPHEYFDAVFKLSLIIGSIGKMPDGSPPPSFFQSLYHLRRLFPSGFLVPEDFIGEVGAALLLRVFATGIAVANQAIYNQRNYNLDWQDMCDIPDSYVDSFEMMALSALNGEVFDLSQDRGMYLDWLSHLGYHAEFHHHRTTQSYLRSSADLVAFAHARAFSLPHNHQPRRIHPIHLPSLETLSLMLCWGTGVTPLQPFAIQYDHLAYTLREARDINATSPSGTPTAADVLAAVAEECTSRLLYPLSVQTNHHKYLSA
ncbi:hypothetical protein DFH07DRAFT_952508 [Mycena maculata]|uniref:Uncharacterized protein n=1 Tax=Mycena maculata TaxID=230809 RepID=A0AAD7K291_9AGAR|nr:hypothetical protein DFH07DRAFT_952508 [Mycena maculata]